MKLTVEINGKEVPASCKLKVLSTSDIVGEGEDFGEALLQVKEQLTNHVKEVNSLLGNINAKLMELGLIQCRRQGRRLGEVHEEQQDSPISVSEVEFLKEIGIDYYKFRDNYLRVQKELSNESVAQRVELPTEDIHGEGEKDKEVIFNVTKEDYEGLCEAYQQAQYELCKRWSAIYNLKNSLEFQQLLLKDTIAREQGKESSVVKLKDIESFVTYLTAFNQQLINSLDYALNRPLEEVKGEVDNLMSIRGTRKKKEE